MLQKNECKDNTRDSTQQQVHTSNKINVREEYVTV